MMRITWLGDDVLGNEVELGGKEGAVDGQLQSTRLVVQLNRDD